MNFKKIFYLTGLLAFSVLLLVATPGWSGVEGGAPAPTDWDKVVGPELWAVVVIHCGQAKDIAVMRAKGIFDCNVKTQTLVDPAYNLDCINDESLFLYERFPKSYFFAGEQGIPAEAGEWIITRIKYYKFDTTSVANSTIISFEAQIKFEKD